MFKVGDKVIFANDMDIKEGTIIKIHGQDSQSVLVIDDPMGSTFFRPLDKVMLAVPMDEGAVKMRANETLEQALYKDIHDIANSCDKDNELEIEGWVEHIKSTFVIYGYQIGY